MYTSVTLPPKMSQNQPKLYIYDYGICYLAHGIKNEMHGHYAASLLIGLDSDLTIRLPEDDPGRDSSIIRSRLVALAPNTKHSLTTEPGARIVVIQWDLDSFQYPMVPALETESVFRADFGSPQFENILPNAEIEAWENAYKAELDCAEIAAMMASTLGHFSRGAEAQEESIIKLDERIKTIVDYLGVADLTESIPLSRLAEKVALSEDRLMRLFRSELGLPYRRFLLWLKVRRAALSLGQGVTLTEAAHAAGFSDSAHLSRTFKEMFGTKPSFFFSNTRFIQVFHCEAE